jgi:SAM-dependent methyltransferase
VTKDAEPGEGLQGTPLKLALYDELVPWYRLLDPTEDHREEAAIFASAFERAVEGSCATLLELGSGAGNNAFHMKRRFRCALADPSEPMLTLSREINPECEHIIGDMRCLRLNRTFDAVLVHDAVVYMASEADLAAAARTAFVHTRPGGAAIFAPDCVREIFRESTKLFEADEGRMSLRCLEWIWDPDPEDDQCVIDYAFLARRGTEMRAVHERHVEGLFAQATWLRILAGAGYRVEMIGRPVGEGETDRVFLCRRPASQPAAAYRDATDAERSTSFKASA